MGPEPATRRAPCAAPAGLKLKNVPNHRTKTLRATLPFCNPGAERDAPGPDRLRFFLFETIGERPIGALSGRFLNFHDQVVGPGLLGNDVRPGLVRLLV